MKKILFALIATGLLTAASSQSTILPAEKQKGLVFIKNATIHVGNGKVMERGKKKTREGKIGEGGVWEIIPAGDVSVIDATGKHVYPGIILPTSTLGLVEISAVRATNDVREMGDLNPSVRSIVAYNADSKVINTLRSNGVLLANVIPQGSLLAGSSSVVQLDAWNWQDAAYKMDGGMHLYMPSMMTRFGRGGFGGGGRFGGPNAPAGDPVQRGMEEVEKVKTLLREAKAYAAQAKPEETNLKFEAVKPLLEKKQKLYVHANTVTQMLAAMDFVTEFGVDMVIIGGSESYQITDLLKQHKVGVILQQPHSLPTATDDDVDQPYKTAAMLQKAGVLFSISDDDGHNRGRNIVFNAGTTAAYGLNKEEALQAITLNAAKLLGIDERTGSIETGKDANIVISEGDILDMRSSVVTDAFIQGRKINLDDKQKQLFERYNQKYNLKKPF